MASEEKSTLTRCLAFLSLLLLACDECTEFVLRQPSFAGLLVSAPFLSLIHMVRAPREEKRWTKPARRRSGPPFDRLRLPSSPRLHVRPSPFPRWIPWSLVPGVAAASISAAPVSPPSNPIAPTQSSPGPVALVPKHTRGERALLAASL